MVIPDAASFWADLQPSWWTSKVVRWDSAWEKPLWPNHGLAPGTLGAGPVPYKELCFYEILSVLMVPP